eukprot:scaffold13628_cov31-Tisochrysis_lutea.AAC.1
MRASCCARLMAFARARCFLACTPVSLRGRMAPPSETKRQSSGRLVCVMAERGTSLSGSRSLRRRAGIWSSTTCSSRYAISASPRTSSTLGMRGAICASRWRTNAWNCIISRRPTSRTSVFASARPPRPPNPEPNRPPRASPALSSLEARPARRPLATASISSAALASSSTALESPLRPCTMACGSHVRPAHSARTPAGGARARLRVRAASIAEAERGG